MKKSSLFVLPLLLVVGLSGCASVGAATPGSSASGASTSSTPAGKSTTSAAAAASPTVVYSVTGTDTAKSTSISYMTLNNGKTGQSQANGEKLPWTKTVKIKADGMFDVSVFSLTAQAAEGTKKISCKITANGKVISEETSTGDYAVVSCSGSPK